MAYGWSLPGVVLAALAFFLSEDVAVGTHIQPTRSVENEFVFFLHDPDGLVPLERVAQAERRLARRRERIRLALVGGQATAFPISIHLYPSVEAKGLATADMSVAHAVPGAHAVHLSLQPGLEGDGVAVEMLPLLRTEWGDPTFLIIEAGAVVLLSDGWLGGDPRAQVGRAHRAALVPPLTDLLDNTFFRGGSGLLLPAVGSVFLAWLLDEADPPPGFPSGATDANAGGWERFAALYRDWHPTPSQVVQLERRWIRHLDALEAAAGMPPAPSRPRTTQNFRRGFNFAHEGYRIHNGFGSARATGSLQQLARMGTNAVAILPYTLLAAPGAPGPFPIPSRAGSENDEAVIHAILAAKTQGMEVMLKPHVWLRGSWAGEIRMSTEKEWEHFFVEYARWMGHYALLAEALEVEALCIGTELSAAALERPEDWRSLASRIREVYSGRLGYCANWGDEAEKLYFWDAVDFIGVSFYYPLSPRANPSDEELRRAADQALDRLEELGRRNRRPVILAEAGFASSPAPWRRPWEEERGSGARVDMEAQARGYRILTQALEGRKGIHGIYWWKWPTTGPPENREHSGFTPAGKPAERVVSAWFLRLASQVHGP